MNSGLPAPLACAARALEHKTASLPTGLPARQSSCLLGQNHMYAIETPCLLLPLTTGTKATLQSLDLLPSTSVSFNLGRAWPLGPLELGISSRHFWLAQTGTPPTTTAATCVLLQVPTWVGTHCCCLSMLVPAAKSFQWRLSHGHLSYSIGDLR